MPPLRSLGPLTTSAENPSECGSVIGHDPVEVRRQQLLHVVLIIHDPNKNGNTIAMVGKNEALGHYPYRSAPNGDPQRMGGELIARD